MSKRTRPREELEDLLAEQIQFLEASADAFDRGCEGEAKRLAVTARVLLHDTRQSHSLLGQLERKDLSLWDTALALDPCNVMTHSGLVFIAMGDPNPKYVAMLDDVPRLRQTPFDEWWNSAVFSDSQQNTLSRKDLVLTAANQDGGAHVDTALDEIYARLSKDNSMGWVYTDGRGASPLPGPERAAIRQIAHELLKTLKPGYKKKIEHPVQMLIGGMAIKGGDAAVGPFVSMLPESTVSTTNLKIARNERCPCGSGSKYKHCHGKLA